MQLALTSAAAIVRVIAHVGVPSGYLPHGAVLEDWLRNTRNRQGCGLQLDSGRTLAQVFVKKTPKKHCRLEDAKKKLLQKSSLQA